MLNRRARYSVEKNRDDMHDEQDLLELFGKALKSRFNAHNSTIPLSKF